MSGKENDGAAQLQQQKTRALMKSIDSLRKQVDQLKSENKDTYQAKLVQVLKKEKRELELVSDYLKEELRKEKGISADEIDQQVIKQTLGGPKRFRPKTREELGVEIRQLKSKLQNAQNNAPSQPRTIYAAPPVEPIEEKSEPKPDGDRSTESVAKLLEVVDSLRIDLAAREQSSKAYIDTIAKLREDSREYQNMKDKLDRTSDKYSRLKQNMRGVQGELAASLQQCEEMEEDFKRLETEHACLKEIVDEQKPEDNTRELELLDTIRQLKAKEVNLLEDLDSLQVQLAEVKQRVFTNKSVSQDEQKVRNQMNELQNENDSLKEQIKNPEKVSNIEELQQIALLKKENQNQLLICDELKNSVQEMKSHISELENQKKKIESANHDLNVQVNDLTDQLAVGQFAKSGGDESFAPDECIAIDSSNELASKNDQIESMENEIEELHQVIEHLETQNTEYKNGISAASNESRKGDILFQSAQSELIKSHKQMHELHSLLNSRIASNNMKQVAKDVQRFYNSNFKELGKECNANKAAVISLRLVLERLKQYSCILYDRLVALGQKVEQVPDLKSIVPLPVSQHRLDDISESEESDSTSSASSVQYSIDSEDEEDDMEEG